MSPDSMYESRSRVSRALVVTLLCIPLAGGGCASLNKTEKGAGTGAAVGAAVGGLIGRANGSTAKGAILGAVVGGAAGAVIGHRMDEQAKELDNKLPNASVERVGEGIQITFDSGILFDVDSDVLRVASRDNLSALANSISEYPGTKILVVGHTDSTGSDSYNQSLSERRANSARTFLLQQGVSLGVMYGNKAVRSISQLYDDPAKKAQSGAGQAYDPANFVVNEEGYVVRKDQWRTVDEKPIKYVDATGSEIVKIGDANPDFNMSFNPIFNWKRFAINGLLDWSQGGDIYNGTRQWPFFDNRDRIYDQRGKPDAEKKNQSYYNFFYNSLNPIDFFVESGTYVKIKELAVHYTFDRNQLSKIGLGKIENVRIGVIGRNLFTFTNYSGYDPEVGSPFANDPYQVRFDWFTYPHFRTFTGLVEIAF